ncbi:ubiquitin-protein ligase [Rhizoctonia solani AG-1 IA]|uniref:Anaphase-promoting complex subunit 2 n=1 Tax=Thanatephorus cucumeris (strain AG1-IA) TaxID=983506 RepID=L8X189_THACA|nr:ubiquitin-protein ligase [Rhizoctonia solani AG-1 IA]
MEQKPISELMLRASWNDTLKRMNGDKPGRIGLLQNGAWSIVCDHIRPHDINKPKGSPRASNDIVARPLKMLESISLLGPLLQWFTDVMSEMMPMVTSDIATYIDRWENTQDVSELYHMFARLSVWYFEWSAPLAIFSSVNIDAPTLFRKNFRTNFLSTLPRGFPVAFHALLRSTLAAPALDPRLFPILDVMGLLQDHEALVASVIHEAIEKRVKEVCEEDNGETSVLQTVKNWFTESVVPWMAMTYGRGLTDEVLADMLQKALAPAAGKFDYHICKVLCEISSHTGMHGTSRWARESCTNFAEAVRIKTFQLRSTECLGRNNKRLLHPGADTKDILTQYVSTIRCLRILDPPGVLLFKVADPIRRYLRERPDTIRCIVSNLVGDGSDLLEENEQVLPIQALNEPYEDYSDPQWDPEPNDAEPDFRTSKPGDIVSTLVSIYDSRDLFVKELQSMLGQRLLAVKDHNYDNETRNVEILKLRFGEAALQLCDVMLRDVTDSRRVDKHVAGRLNEDFEKEYTEHKAGKKLRWMNNLGTVSLDLELEDRVVSADASPLEAAVVELFSEQSESVAFAQIDKPDKLGINDSTPVRAALMFWTSNGVLKPLEDGQYELLERVEAEESVARRPILSLQSSPPAETAPGPTTEDAAQQTAQMELFWNFIKGILTNLGAMPIDRIQAMLSLAPNYNKSKEQLSDFLDAARAKGLVDYNNGMWKLVRG